MLRDIEVRIPIPEWILAIKDDQKRRAAMKECWGSYSMRYGDDYELKQVRNGEFIMTKK
ncbi:hypothetical protein [Brevibacillus laterosporus]|uniref:Uncharacterized protein n=1 Tax=Brevibacillus laterosporus LMG 15441 TaxID=1042163 RepID=A0A075R7Q0_BRELA|nr:hypothetical protein [Brevibacillus laterosporus]AIG27451.1 hypothetical protein BRLA_c031390 [Brevibacillus laterosporus LMG 15441]